jgi:DNA recombination protein RmuC
VTDYLPYVAIALASLILGALLAYWLAGRGREQWLVAKTHELEMQRQNELHGFGLREASLQQELAQLKTQQQEAKIQWSQLQLEKNQQQLLLGQVQQDLAAAREKVARLAEVEEALHSKQNQHAELEQIYAALNSRLEQERRNFAEQLALLQNARVDLTREFENLAGKIFEAKQQQFQANSKSLLDTTLEPLKTQLTEFRKKVEDVYDKESAERNRLAGQVLELQKQAQKIGEDAVNLAQALKGNSKTQGNWGEVVLERLLEESGLQKGREYDTQVNATNADGGRLMPDVIVHLPENKDIVIDAKCSLVDYERYCSTDNDDERKQYLANHIQSLRNHIKSLSIKDYEKLEGIKSLDFVFIFIPIEAAFMIALQEDPRLYREAYDRHIILVSPTTLLATLRTVENIWRYEKQNKNAERIAKEAGSLHDQFVLLLESLDSIGNYLHKTQEAYSKARERLQTGRGNLVKKVDDIRRLGAKTKKSISSSALLDAGAEEEILGDEFLLENDDSSDEN